MIWQEWFRDQFLSTPSARRATIPAAIVFLGDLISIHALREEGDKSVKRSNKQTEISIHALREEGDIFGFPDTK